MNPPRFGDDPAKDEDVDPAHIIALAQRVGNLGEEIAALRHEVAELDNDLTDRLLTKEQVTEIREILGERAGRKWFQSRLRYYGWGLLAFLGGIYVIRDYLSAFFVWLSRVLK